MRVALRTSELAKALRDGATGVIPEGIATAIQDHFFGSASTSTTSSLFLRGISPSAATDYIVLEFVPNPPYHIGAAGPCVTWASLGPVVSSVGAGSLSPSCLSSVGSSVGKASVLGSSVGKASVIGPSLDSSSHRWSFGWASLGSGGPSARGSSLRGGGPYVGAASHLGPVGSSFGSSSLGGGSRSFRRSSLRGSSPFVGEANYCSLARGSSCGGDNRGAGGSNSSGVNEGAGGSNNAAGKGSGGKEGVGGFDCGGIPARGAGFQHNLTPNERMLLEKIEEIRRDNLHLHHAMLKAVEEAKQEKAARRDAVFAAAQDQVRLMAWITILGLSIAAVFLMYTVREIVGDVIHAEIAEWLSSSCPPPNDSVPSPSASPDK